MDMKMDEIRHEIGLPWNVYYTKSGCLRQLTPKEWTLIFLWFQIFQKVLEIALDNLVLIG